MGHIKRLCVVAVGVCVGFDGVNIAVIFPYLLCSPKVQVVFVSVNVNVNAMVVVNEGMNVEYLCLSMSVVDL